MCANAQDVQGGWMHVFLLNVNNNEAKALLRSSVRAQTSAPISMACTVHTYFQENTFQGQAKVIVIDALLHKYTNT